MGIVSDISLFALKLDSAIKDIIETDLANEIRDEMSTNIESYSFTRSRGPSGMGVRDKRNFKAEVLDSGSFSAAASALGGSDVYILRVTDIAPFQSDARIDKSLAEVVEEGDERYRIYMARPFIAPTQMVMDNGLADAVVASGLRSRGFTVV